MQKRLIILLIIAVITLLTGCSSADSDIILTETTMDVQDESGLNNSSIDALADVEEKSGKIIVHVCGAVQKPGVYELEEGSRIIDALECAGGFGEDADEAYLNLAATLTDGAKVQIPTLEETAVMPSSLSVNGGALNSSTGQKLVNINCASREELKTLPGVGDGIAGRIVEYRTQNGSFASIEEIKKVSGIKDKLFNKIKDYIVV